MIPEEIKQKMMEHQEAQGNPRDWSVFDKYDCANKSEGGFNWIDTPEKNDFWGKVLTNEKYDLFFQRYPKEKTFPRKMLVWDDEESTAIELIVLWENKFGKPAYRFLAISEERFNSQYEYIPGLWKHAKDLPEAKKMTVEEMKAELEKSLGCEIEVVNKINP